MSQMAINGLAMELTSEGGTTPAFSQDEYHVSLEQQEIIQLTEQISDCRRDEREMAEVVQQLQQHVKERDQCIDALTSRVQKDAEERHECIEELKASLHKAEERDRRIEELEAEIQRLRTQSGTGSNGHPVQAAQSEQPGLILVNASRVSEMEAAARNLHAAVRAREAKLSEMEALAAARAVEIAQLEMQTPHALLAERDAKIINLEAFLRAKESQFDEMKQRFKDLEVLIGIGATANFNTTLFNDRLPVESNTTDMAWDMTSGHSQEFGCGASVVSASSATHAQTAPLSVETAPGGAALSIETTAGRDVTGGTEHFCGNIPTSYANASDAATVAAIAAAVAGILGGDEAPAETVAVELPLPTIAGLAIASPTSCHGPHDALNMGSGLIEISPAMSLRESLSDLDTLRPATPESLSATIPQRFSSMLSVNSANDQEASATVPPSPTQTLCPTAMANETLHPGVLASPRKSVVPRLSLGAVFGTPGGKANQTAKTGSALITQTPRTGSALIAVNHTPRTGSALIAVGMTPPILEGNQRTPLALDEASYDSPPQTQRTPRVSSSGISLAHLAAASFLDKKPWVECESLGQPGVHIEEFLHEDDEAPFGVRNLQTFQGSRPTAPLVELQTPRNVQAPGATLGASQPAQNTQIAQATGNQVASEYALGMQALGVPAFGTQAFGTPAPALGAQSPGPTAQVPPLQMGSIPHTPLVFSPGPRTGCMSPLPAVGLRNCSPTPAPRARRGSSPVQQRNWNGVPSPVRVAGLPGVAAKQVPAPTRRSATSFARGEPAGAARAVSPPVAQPGNAQHGSPLLVCRGQPVTVDPLNRSASPSALHVTNCAVAAQPGPGPAYRFGGSGRVSMTGSQLQMGSPRLSPRQTRW